MTLTCITLRRCGIDCALMTMMMKRIADIMDRGRSVRLALAFFLYFVAVPGNVRAQNFAGNVTVDVPSTLRSLLQDEDTDGDHRITINDSRIGNTERGNKRFTVVATNGRTYEVSGTYYLSNLLQELGLLRDEHQGSGLLRGERIFEAPIERISRSIRESYWEGLTRAIDEQGVPQMIQDEKTSTLDGRHYLYVPSGDPVAIRYYQDITQRHPEWNVRLEELPDSISPSYMRSIEGKHGLLTLGIQRGPGDLLRPIPFVVPGGRFNEMYGWDSYFIALGLLADHRVDLAKGMVENQVYEIMHYGKILNANRTYYLTRSQPPFLTSMAKAVYSHLEKNAESKLWLRTVIEAAVREYNEVWMNRDHLTATGLSRYFDAGTGPAPEVEPGHYDLVFRRFARQYGMRAGEFERKYRSGTLHVPELDRYFVHDRAMRESGHDTSYRLEGRCADLVTVDLNSLLYKIETDLAAMIAQEFGGKLRTSSGNVERAGAWAERGERRRQLMTQLLWNPNRGMFFDYDFVQKRQTGYVSATTLYPLWAGLATAEQAKILVAKALPLLQAPGGILGSTEESRGPITSDHPSRQWDFPYGWAPHQVLVWQGLKNYGFDHAATTLAYRWLYTIAVNAASFNGTVPEKFDVERRTHEVYAEYGNVGTTFSYITKEGFGWTNASFQIGIALLSARERGLLDRLIPPEWVYGTSR